MVAFIRFLKFSRFVALSLFLVFGSAAADQSSNFYPTKFVPTADQDAFAKSAAKAASVNDQKIDPASVQRRASVAAISEITSDASRQQFAKEMAAAARLNTNPVKTAPKNVLDTIAQSSSARSSLVNPLSRTVNMQLFLSFSEGESELRNAFAIGSRHPNLQIIFRGFSDSADIPGSIKKLHALAREFTPVPNVVINPVHFKTYNVQSVPFLIYTQSNDQHYRVGGLIDPAWIKREAAYHVGGFDFGNKGRVLPISEVDPTDLMKERVSKIDWDEKRRGAIGRFWKNQKSDSLPVTLKNSRRFIDPGVSLNADLTDGEGRVILKSGSTVNPLSVMPFTKTLFVFDASDMDQVNAVLTQAAELSAANRPVVLLASRFDKAGGWEAYRSLTEKFRLPVFSLTPEIKQRFAIRSVPTLVYSNGSQFVVDEFSVREAEL